MKKSYQYRVLLRNTQTGDCVVKDIKVDHDGCMDANTIFKKLAEHPDVFEAGYTLLGLNIGIVTDLES